MNQVSIWFILALGLLSSVTNALEPTNKVRLFVLDCGRIDVQDFGSFSDTGEYDGKAMTLSDPCFLIQHPKGLLMWDTGVGDGLFGKAVDFQNGFRPTVQITLESQLTKLGISNKDIQYVAFSHSHWDHVGNLGLFKEATWLLQEKETKHFLQESSPVGVKADRFASYENSKKLIFSGDHDVFGDGSVKILSTPGHTPGHQSLLVKTRVPTLLSGDLYHQQESHKHKRVPAFNTSRPETLASFDRISTILKNLKARIVVQHDMEDFKTLPKIPQYLE